MSARLNPQIPLYHDERILHQSEMHPKKRRLIQLSRLAVARRQAAERHLPAGVGDGVAAPHRRAARCRAQLHMDANDMLVGRWGRAAFEAQLQRERSRHECRLVSTHIDRHVLDTGVARQVGRDAIGDQAVVAGVDGATDIRAREIAVERGITRQVIGVRAVDAAQVSFDRNCSG